MTEDMKRSIKDAIRAAYDAGYNHGNKDGSQSCSRYVGGNVELEMGNSLIAQLAAAPVAAPPTLPRYLLDMIGNYGMARTETVGELEVQHRWETLIGGIKRYAADYAAATPVAAQSEPLPRFMLRKIEAAIQEATSPRGMSLHDGKAKIDAAILSRLLILAAPIPAQTDDIDVEEHLGWITRNVKREPSPVEQDPNLHYNVPEVGGPITSYYVASDKQN